MNLTTSKTDHRELVQRMFQAYENLALVDIERALEGNCKLGALILAACFIDYMAKIAGVISGSIGKNKSRDNYIAFVRQYMLSYDAEKLYEDLRCDLVHAYTGLGEYMYVADNSDVHLKMAGSPSKMLVNVEDFISDVKAAFYRFREEVLSDGNKIQLVFSRIKEKRIGFIEEKDILHPLVRDNKNVTQNVTFRASSGN